MVFELANDGRTTGENDRGALFRLRAYNEVTSTNDLVKRALEAGESEGLAVGALVQTAGYGRQGRGWVSPLGGMYVSLLLRPQVAVGQLPTLSLVAGLAVRRAIARFLPDDVARDVKIKWPNDVVYSAAVPLRKLCGISLERHAGGVCVGIGVNVFPPDDERGVAVGGKNVAAYVSELASDERLAVASAARDVWGRARACDARVAFDARDAQGNVLAHDAGDVQAASDTCDVCEAHVARAEQAFSRDAQVLAICKVRAAVLDEFAALYEMWCARGFEPLAADYTACAALDGRMVTVENLDGSVLARGLVQGVDVWGRLLVFSEGASDPVAVASGEAHIADLR